MNINAWFAEQCGVKYLNRHKAYGMLDPTQKDELGLYIKWDIKDPRCMQVVREKYKIGEIWSEAKGVWCCAVSACLDIDDGAGTGKTIPEAEYACYEAIYESMKRDKP